MSAEPPADAADRHRPRPKGEVVDIAAFLMELVVLVTLVIAGARIGHGMAVHILLAIALPLVALVVWSLWMAPQSSRRLPDPARFIAQVVLFVATAVLCAVGDLAGWGIAVAVVATIVFGLTRVGGAGDGTRAG